MRAAILAEYGRPLVVEDVEPIPPGPEDVVVRTRASALCITDCFIQRGDLGAVPRDARALEAAGDAAPPPVDALLPLIPGHAAVGVVEAAGDRVTRLRVGETVVVPATPECGACFWCARGRPDQCAMLFLPPPPVATRADGTSVRAGGGTGTYAELLKLPQSRAFPVESELPADQLSLLGCGVTSGLGAVFNVAGVDPGSSVAVVGCGHLGLWIVQGARVAGATQVIAVDPHAGRRATAERLGATDLVDPGDGDPVEQVLALTEGRGADYGIEAGGPPDAAVLTFMVTRRAGVVVLTGIINRTATVTLPQWEFALRGKDVRSCQQGRTLMRRDIPRYVRLIEEGRVDAAAIVTRRYPLDGINDALRAAEREENLTGVIMFE